MDYIKPQPYYDIFQKEFSQEDNNNNREVDYRIIEIPVEKEVIVEIPVEIEKVIIK